MKRNMGPIIIAVIGAILTIAGAVIQYREKEHSKRAATKAKKEAEEFNAKLLESQANLITAQEQAKIESDKANKEIIRLNKNLLQDSEAAKKTQQETINFILGSGIPELSFYGKSQGVFAPVLFNPTAYPIYDVSVTIDDFDKILANCNIVELVDKILIIDYRELYTKQSFYINIA